MPEAVRRLNRIAGITPLPKDTSSKVEKLVAMMSKRDECVLVHITTVPSSLWSFLSGQIKFMSRRGFRVHAISSPGDKLDEFGEKNEIDVHGIPMARAITPLRDLVALLRIWRVLLSEKATIVCAHTPKGGLLGMIAAWLARTPVRIYQIHGFPFMAATGLRRSLLKWTERLSCWFATDVLAVSHGMREVAIAERICPAKKVKVLGSGSSNGVDAQGKFNPANVTSHLYERIRTQHGIPRDALVLGFVGRIVRDKGWIELANAWKELRDQFPSAHLLAVGPLESQDPIPVDVEELIRKDRRIHRIGLIENVAPCYRAMDVCVLPSYREGFGVVCIEAAAMKLPVVATSIPGCSEAVLDGVTGTLVPPRDAMALAEAIRRYLADPELRIRHGEAGRQRVLREFRPVLLWEAYYQEYVQQLREKGLPSFEEESFDAEEGKAA